MAKEPSERRQRPQRRVAWLHLCCPKPSTMEYSARQTAVAYLVRRLLLLRQQVPRTSCRTSFHPEVHHTSCKTAALQLIRLYCFGALRTWCRTDFLLPEPLHIGYKCPARAPPAVPLVRAPYKRPSRVLNCNWPLQSQLAPPQIFESGLR